MVTFGKCGKIARIYKIKAVHLAAVLVGVFFDYGRKGILTMTRSATPALDPLNPVRKGTSFDASFLAVPSVQAQNVIIHVRQIKTKAEYPLNNKGPLAAILGFYSTRHNAGIFKNRVVKGYLQSRNNILGVNFEGLGPVAVNRVCRRQSRNPRLTAVYFMSGITDIGYIVAVFVFDR